MTGVCTLYEGHYHYGVAGWINSLVASKYEGVIHVGVRGPLPPWITQLEEADDKCYRLPNSKGVVRFWPIETPWHLTNYKPVFMQMLFESEDIHRLAYFDPDITVRCRWSFFDEWMGFGVALCQEITNSAMPVNHPVRMKWVEFGKKYGLGEPRLLSQYFNAGFVGVDRKHRSLLALWEGILKLVGEKENDLATFVGDIGDRTWPFYSADQDGLNVAIMYSEIPLSTIGPEGMGFVHGGFTMFHAVGGPKPWKKNHLARSLRGFSPAPADKDFLRHSSGPIKLYGELERRIKLVDYAIASGISRFYTRPN